MFDLSCQPTQRSKLSNICFLIAALIISIPSDPSLHTLAAPQVYLVHRRTVHSKWSHNGPWVTQRKATAQDKNHPIQQETSSKVSLRPCTQSTGGKPTNVALLIDGDHIAASHFPFIVEELLKHGMIVLCRVYCKSRELADTWSSINDFNLTVLRLEASATKTKEFIDLHIVWDTAMLVLNQGLASTDFGISALTVTAVAIASSDNDFQVVFERVMKRSIPNFKMFLVRRSHELSFRMTSSSSSLGAQVVPYSLTTDTKQDDTHIIMSNGVSYVTHKASSSEVQNVAEVAAAVQKLESLGYNNFKIHKRCKITKFAKKSNLLVTAFAKFFYVNELNLTLYPPAMTLTDALNVLKTSSCKPWKQDPGNLILIWPIRGQRLRERSTLTPGGNHSALPFILQRSPLLVKDVLERLGYPTSEGQSVYYTSIIDFCKLNAPYLAKLGFHANPTGADELGFRAIPTGVDELEQMLYDAFSCQKGPQYWLSC